MRGSLAIMGMVVLFAARATAAQEKNPKEFLTAARAKYCDHTAKGLKSFTARVELKYTSDPKIEKNKALLSFDYAWTAPDKGEFRFDPKSPKSTQAGMRKAVGELWMYITGAGVFPLLESAEGLEMEEGEGKVTLSGKVKVFGASKISFDAESYRMIEWELVQAKVKITFSLGKEEGFFRIEKREADKDGKKGSLSFTGFRKVNKFSLPTGFDLLPGKNSYKFAVEYISINEQPAETAELDLKVIKERVKAFEKGWRKWSPEEKIEQMKLISAEIEHDLVSAAIAKWGLRDRDLTVRQGTAKFLGLMKRRNVVPAVISAMKANEKNIKVYLQLIWTLGELNDPRAVKLLSTDWWNQRIGEYGVAAAKAKIKALGNIRHTSSVDALVDIFYMTRDRT
ncbi:MAG: HEAT repeat domain-containing protein, partial [Planctomycetota bacterium]